MGSSLASLCQICRVSGFGLILNRSADSIAIAAHATARASDSTPCWLLPSPLMHDIEGFSCATELKVLVPSGHSQLAA